MSNNEVVTSVLKDAAASILASLAHGEDPWEFVVDEDGNSNVPDDERQVLVFLSGNIRPTDPRNDDQGYGIRTGYFDHDRRYWRAGGRIEHYVTHWMNLPAEPRLPVTESEAGKRGGEVSEAQVKRRCGVCKGVGEVDAPGNTKDCCERCDGEGHIDAASHPMFFDAERGVVHDGFFALAEITYDAYISKEDQVKNGKLFAEAGTVLHETGLTPRELVSQRDELLKEIKRHIPILEWLERRPELWNEATAGTGIATLNRLLHVMKCGEKS